MILFFKLDLHYYRRKDNNLFLIDQKFFKSFYSVSSGGGHRFFVKEGTVYKTENRKAQKRFLLGGLKNNPFLCVKFTHNMGTKNQFCYEYPRPAVTADCVIFGYTGSELQLLLIERGNEPFKGEWALPGGFLDMDEDADTCARRELQEETGLENVYMEQLYTFSRVDRDPRGRVITVAYYALVNLSDCQMKAGDDAVNARWFALSELPELAFDHADIIQTAIGRLRGNIRYQPLGFELLPEQFTLVSDKKS